jgi:hypothetical protein
MGKTANETRLICDFKQKETKLKRTIKVANKAHLNLTYYLIANGCHKTYDFAFLQQANSHVQIAFYIYAINHGSINIKLSNIVKKGVDGCTIKQIIEGVNDRDSTIKVIPGMIVETNQINATHNVSIGHFDPEKIFYLACKGVNEQMAKR